MRLPHFVLGMLCVLVVFAVVTYALTGSGWMTVVETVACAVLIQVGYFLVVVLMVARGSDHDRGERSPDRKAGRTAGRGLAKISVLQGLRRLGILP